MVRRNILTIGLIGLVFLIELVVGVPSISFLMSAQLIKINSPKLEEGEFLNTWLRRRLLETNRNGLLGITGGTGSGKSYWALSAIQTYYRKVLKKEFPVENIVFSPLELVKRLKYFEKENLTGEIVLCDEWGCNNSSHDWQSKTQKALSYVMQSFRSMNVGLVLTLPVLTMLNKSTRLLLHGHFITAGIDYENKTCKVKPLFHQLNQLTGKSFWKYPRINHNGSWRKLKRLSVGLPSKELIEVYEAKKTRFVSKTIDDFEALLEAEEVKGDKRNARPLLTTKQLEVFNMRKEGMNNKEIAEELKKSQSSISERFKGIEKKGYSGEEIEKYQEKSD